MALHFRASDAKELTKRRKSNVLIWWIECFVFRSVTHYLRQIIWFWALWLDQKWKVKASIIWYILSICFNHYVENYFLNWITYNCSIIHKHDSCLIFNLSKIKWLKIITKPSLIQQVGTISSDKNYGKVIYPKYYKHWN